MQKAILVLFLLSILFLFFGCIQQQANASSEQLALKECKELCTASLVRSDIPWPSGPCLGNPMQTNTDWVCDTAHNPRTAVDDLSENQCSAFPAQAKHFVELNTECNLISLN